MSNESHIPNPYVPPKVVQAETSNDVQAISLALGRIPLLLSGCVYLALAAVACLVPYFFEFDDDEADAKILFIAIGVISAALGFAIVVLAFVMGLRSAVIYYMMFALTILYLPSAFFPFGIPLLIFLLRKEVRLYYGAGF